MAIQKTTTAGATAQTFLTRDASPGVSRHAPSSPSPGASMDSALSQGPGSLAPRRANQSQASGTGTGTGASRAPRGPIADRPSASSPPNEIVELEDGRLRRLKGVTIDPAVATAIVAEAEADLAANGRRLNVRTASPGVVKFDGTGRIISLKPGAISDELAARLEAAVIKPLAATKSPAAREAPRPARSILTVAMHHLRHDQSPEGKVAMADARKLFLTGSFTRESVAAFIKKCARQLSADESLRCHFEALAAEIEKPISTPQLADNLYGRTFESLLVEDLVRDPPAGVLIAGRQLGAAVLTTLAQFESANASELVNGIAAQVRDDWRIWYGQSPSMKAFAREPSMEALKACLEDVSNGIESIKITFIATHMCRSINTRLPADAMPAWLQRADAFYWPSIVPQKPEKTPLQSDEVSRQSGNWLRYQPNATTLEMRGRAGKNMTHVRVIAPDAAAPSAPSTFVKDALTRGQTVVSGASGQTNLLWFLGEHIASGNPEFVPGDHHLNTLMALVFDGGHSTEEVLYTLDRIEKSNTPWLASLAALLSCSPDTSLRGYEAIAALADNDADQQDLRKRLENALDKTLDYHEQHVLPEAADE